MSEWQPGKLAGYLGLRNQAGMITNLGLWRKAGKIINKGRAVRLG
jgi:hypothetical protein